MKALRFILALYIAFLTTLPCVDVCDSCSPQGSGQISLYPSNSHSQQHNETDCCSPFCVCNCCQVSVVMQNTIIIPEPIRNCISEIPVCLSGKIREISLPFWQPPKVVIA